MRRRDQPARAPALPVSRAGAGADSDASGVAAPSRRSGRRFDGCPFAPAGGVDDPAGRVRPAVVALACEAGAELIEGVDVVAAAQDANGVTVTSRDGRTFTGSVAIAADGVNSVVARRLGLNTGWPDTAIALDMMEESPRQTLRDVDPSTMWVAYGIKRRAGATAYIFPKRDHVNVGIGYVLNHYRRSVDAHPYEVQRAFVGELRGRGLVEGESARTNFTPFLIPVGGPLRQPGHGRVLLAGDAGGFVNGFTAEGIYYAMVSGEHAARSVVESVRDGVEGLARRYRTRRRSRNWRGAPGFGPDPAVSVRRSPPDCARLRRRGACTGDHPPRPRFRGRRVFVSNAAAPGLCAWRRSWRGGSLWERLRTLAAADAPRPQGQPDGIHLRPALRAPAAARRLRCPARRAGCLPPDGLPRSAVDSLINYERIIDDVDTKIAQPGYVQVAAPRPRVLAEHGHHRRAAAMAVPDGAHQPAAAGEDDALLAQPLRDGVHEGGGSDQPGRSDAVHGGQAERGSGRCSRADRDAARQRARQFPDDCWSRSRRTPRC